MRLFISFVPAGGITYSNESYVEENNHEEADMGSMAINDLTVHSPYTDVFVLLRAGSFSFLTNLEGL